MDYELYGGDASKIDELASGDMFHVGLLRDAIARVYDSKHKIKIYLPKQNMFSLQTEDCFIPLKPIEILFDKKLELFKIYGLELANIVIKENQVSIRISGTNRFYVVTKVVCGKNVCNIYTTTECLI